MFSGIGRQTVRRQGVDCLRLPRKHTAKHIASFTLDGNSTPRWSVPKHLKIESSVLKTLFQESQHFDTITQKGSFQIATG
jgi:hypothetical protein